MFYVVSVACAVTLMCIFISMIMILPVSACDCHAYVCMLSGDPTKARSPALHVSPSQKSPTVTNKQHLCHVGSLSRRGTGFSSSTDRNNNALFKGSRSRSLSASEQLGVISQLPPKRQPNCENANGENRGIFVWTFDFPSGLLRSLFFPSGWFYLWCSYFTYSADRC